MENGNGKRKNIVTRKFCLGVDQGTTGITAILFDEKWNVAGSGYQEITQKYPMAGWVEHDAMEILDAVCRAVRCAVTAAGAELSEIAYLGIDHEGESVVAWDKRTGRPISPVIVWQDRRTAREAGRLAEKYGEVVLEKTGLRVDSYFSATKLKWILDHTPDASELLRDGRLLAGTMDAWIIWNITGGRTFATDASTASRVLLYNIHTQSWDPQLLDIFGVPRSILPDVQDSASYFGETDPDRFLGIRIPIYGALVDQQAALLGQACVTPGMVKTTYGTGCFMLMNTGDAIVSSPNGLLTTVAWQLDGALSFALDGGVYISGAATQWLRDGLQIIGSAAETEKMALAAKSNGGVYFVPAFAGLAAPYWDPYARGAILGITGGTTREQLVRATLESTAYQVGTLLEVMKRDSGKPISAMRCDGGAVENTFLMQFQADILGIPLDVPVITETTALGAAFAAALGAGELQNIGEVADTWKLARQYEPKMSEDQRESLLFHWKRAVERSQSWIVN